MAASSAWSGTLNPPAAARLARDLRAACSGMSAAEWSALVTACAARAASDTARAKVLGFARAGEALSGAVRRYAQMGIPQAARADMERLRRSVGDLPASARRALARFRALSREEQTDQVVDLMLTWIIFWAVAGGADLEGGLPDCDLALGIGAHRNVFSHTILLGLGAELAMRLTVELLDGLIDRMPADRHPVWERIRRKVGRRQGAALTGLWAGLGAHFLKDAGLFAARTKPLTGLPLHLSMRAHQALLFANGAASEVFAFAPRDRAAAQRRSRL